MNKIINYFFEEEEKDLISKYKLLLVLTVLYIATIVL